MADRIDELLAAIDAGSTVNDAPLSLPELGLGFSRSYLAGPTFDFEDEIEAGIATALSNPIETVTSPLTLFAGPKYTNELESIRAQQERFKDKVDYLDNATEIGSSILLNPLDKLGKLARGAKYGKTTLSRLFSNPISQGAIAGAGQADGEDIVKAAGKGALFGTAGSAAGATLGSVASKAGREADRLKLSAFGITVADLNRQIKKLGDAAPDSADRLPLLNTLERAEKQGLVSTDNDVLANMAGVLDEQGKLATRIRDFLSGVSDNVPADPVFDAPNTMRFINGLSGTAKDKAVDKFVREFGAITDQLKTGSILDLQRAKVGLNYAWEKDAMGENIIKTLREDLKEAIEKRINLAVKKGTLPESAYGQIKNLNREWGDLAELKDAFARRAGRDLGGDIIEDIFQGAKTTSGMGTANIASAITGNPIYAAIGTGLNIARGSAGKNMLADTLREFQTPLKSVGSLFAGEKGPAPVTARSSIEMLDALGGNQKKEEAPEARIDKLLSVIDSALSGRGDQKGSQTSDRPRGQSQIESKSKVPEAHSSLLDFSIIPSAYGDTLEEAELSPAVYTPKTTTQDILRGDMQGDIDIDSLVKAVIGQESGGRADAVSPKGATGLMQIMPATAREIAGELGLSTYDLKDPATSKLMGTYYLRKMLDKFGDPELALAAYNAGPSRVQGWIDKYGPSWAEISRALSKIRAYEETRNYVPQVLARLQALNDSVEV